MDKARKAALLAAAVTSIACIGDSILYSVLPIYAESLQLSDLWVGLFLSINRFARLLSHGFVAILILKFGPKRIVTVSGFLSCLSTYFYQFPKHLALFATIRIIWGIAYSGLRQSTLLYASHIEHKRKESFALTQFIKSIGPFSILFVGPMMFNLWGYQTSYFLIAIVTITSVLIAICIPNITIAKDQFKFSRVLRFSSFKLLLLLVSFITDGVLVVILFLLFQGRSSDHISLLVSVSLFLLLKKIISSLLPLILTKSYKMASMRLHLFLGIVLIVLGIALLEQYFIYTGLFVCFIGNTLVETTAPIEALNRSSKNSKMEVVTSITFWWDFGKALGALLGIKLYKFLGSEIIWTILISLMIIVAIRYYSLKTIENNTQTQ